MNLEQTAFAIREQFPEGTSPDLEQKARRLERFGQIAFGGFGIVIAVAILGMIGTIFSRMIISGAQPWVGIILVLFLVFAALTLAYVVFNQDLKEKRKAMRGAAAPLTPTDATHDADTNKLLREPASIPVASVTENTTDLLYVESKTRQLDDN